MRLIVSKAGVDGKLWWLSPYRSSTNSPCRKSWYFEQCHVFLCSLIFHSAVIYFYFIQSLFNTLRKDMKRFHAPVDWYLSLYSLLIAYFKVPLSHSQTSTCSHRSDFSKPRAGVWGTAIKRRRFCFVSFTATPNWPQRVGFRVKFLSAVQTDWRIHLRDFSWEWFSFLGFCIVQWRFHWKTS